MPAPAQPVAVVSFAAVQQSVSQQSVSPQSVSPQFVFCPPRACVKPPALRLPPLETRERELARGAG